MKTLLVAINSQFVHSNLAVQYLKASCDESCGMIKVLEFSINEALQQIYAAILLEKPDVAAFSCYIWNIEMVVKLMDDLKKAIPDIIIIAGGPEVSYDGGGLLCGTDYVDYVIGGEGEEKLTFLLKCLNNGDKPGEEQMQWIRNLTTIQNLERIPTPYRLIRKGSLKNRIAYIESSRGCPFQCAYCISSTTQGVRYFPMQHVYEGLEKLVDSGSKIIKFVDRTFNVKEERALEIWNHLLKYEKEQVVFHFEIDPGLLTERMLNCLEKMPVGLIQIEAGIQSIHPITLTAVERPWQIERAFKNLQSLLTFGNIHVHVDLIAGLPYESYPDFRESFNRVYSLNAHHFQLGFLKLLRGSALRKNADRYGYAFREYPPYEILSNKDLSPMEIIDIKHIEACLELFCNSGRFVTTLKVIGHLLAHHRGSGSMDAFGFYESLSKFLHSNGYFDKPIKTSELYILLFQYVAKCFPQLQGQVIHCMRFDYLRSFKNPSLPAFLKTKEDLASRRTRQRWIEKYHQRLEQSLPRLKDHSLEDIWHQIVIGEFDFPEGSGFPAKVVAAVDFGDVSEITGLAQSAILEVLIDRNSS